MRHTASCIALGALLFSLLAAAQGTRPRRDKETHIPPERMEELRGFAVQVADQMIQKNAKDIDHINKRRNKPFPADAQELRRLNAHNQYCLLFKQRIELYREIREKQARYKKKKDPGPEDVEELVALDKRYSETNAEIRALVATYRKEFKREIQDPLEYVLDKLYGPEAEQ